MCDKCREIETKIERYRRIMARAEDPRLAAGIMALIDEAEAEKTSIYRRKQEK